MTKQQAADLLKRLAEIKARPSHHQPEFKDPLWLETAKRPTPSSERSSKT